MLLSLFYLMNFLLKQLDHGLHGLEPLVVASFPTEEFRDHFSSGQDTQ